MPAVRPESLPRALPLPAAASLSENGAAILDALRTGAVGVAAPRTTMDSSGAAPERLHLAQTFVAGLPDDHKQRHAELERRLAAATVHELRVRDRMRIVVEPVRPRDTARADHRGLPERAGPSVGWPAHCRPMRRDDRVVRAGHGAMAGHDARRSAKQPAASPAGLRRPTIERQQQAACGRPGRDALHRLMTHQRQTLP
jgi:hypothetical protein